MTNTLLRRWLLADFGLDAETLVPVDHGADVAAQVWRLTTASGVYAVKWSGAGSDTGHQVAAFLGDCGVPGVPEPVRTLRGGLWSVHAKKRLTVAEWIDGESAADTGLTDARWAEYGGLLRRVHDAEPPPRLRQLLPRRSTAAVRMPALAAEVRERLRDPRDEVEERLGALWREHERTIDHLLTDAPPEPAGRRVVCHGDPHLGNVLVDGGLHLVDWDDAVLAPPEQDLVLLLGGMGRFGPTTDAQREAFLSGYGPHPLDDEAVRHYRHVRALEDVVGWSHQAITGPDQAFALGVARGVLTEGLAAMLVSENR